MKKHKKEKEYFVEGSTKVFRSIIKKYFPVDLLIKLNSITETRGANNNEKTEFIVNLLDEYGIPYSKLGNGTNRYGCLIDGYAIKIALDRAGKTDNKRELKYGKRLYPDVVKVYECLEDGLIAVFEYVTIFSMDDFYENQEKMRDILRRISSQYLIGDIGISQINFVNWGIRSTGEICILDFAYIYSLSYKGFICTCEDEGTLEFDNDFNYLQCPFCKKKYDFQQIRKRISQKDEIEEIGDIKECGYILHKEEETLPIDPKLSPVKIKKKKEVEVPEELKSYLESKHQFDNLTPERRKALAEEFDRLIASI